MEEHVAAPRVAEECAAVERTLAEERALAAPGRSRWRDRRILPAPAGSHRRGGTMGMPDWLGLLIVLGLWMALQVWVLPGLGIPT